MNRKVSITEHGMALVIVNLRVCAASLASDSCKIYLHPRNFWIIYLPSKNLLWSVNNQISTWSIFVLSEYCNRAIEVTLILVYHVENSKYIFFISHSRCQLDQTFPLSRVYSNYVNISC